MPVTDQRVASTDGIRTRPRSVRRRVSATIALSLTAMLVFAPTAQAGGVSIVDFAFQPAKFTAPRGTDVLWLNNSAGGFTHSVTSDKSDSASPRLDYWVRHDFAPGTSFSITFISAGTFFYHCSFHPSMQGKIKIPLGVDHTGSLITIFAASDDFAVSSPFRHVIHWRRGGGTWQTIRTRKAMTSFVASAPGAYDFTAAVFRKSNGATSGWSKIVSLTIS